MMDQARQDVLDALDQGLADLSPPVNDHRPLVRFLYLLARDHLPAGVVESLVRDAVAPVDTSYGNGLLGRYAQLCALRLQVDVAPERSTQSLSAMPRMERAAERLREFAATLEGMQGQMLSGEVWQSQRLRLAEIVQTMTDR